MDNETRKMFELVLKKLDSIEIRLDSVENGQVSMKTRQDEIYEIVNAIEHSNNVHKAEIDNINVRTAYVEGTVNGIGEFINQRKAVK